MTIFCIILVVIAPVIGWRIGCLIRSQVAAGCGRHFIPGMLVGTLPFLPFAFIFFDGILRMAFLAFIGLMIISAFVSAKRATV
jgi:hypothetical protein